MNMQFSNNIAFWRWKRNYKEVSENSEINIKYEKIKQFQCKCMYKIHNKY